MNPAPKPRRGMATIADLKARSVVDAVTGCWHWQGAKSTDGTPRIHTFDHAVGDKRVLNGPQAVWNIAHGESPAPYLAFRRCVCTDCVNPVHTGKAPSRAAIGLHIRLSGARKGTSIDARMANLAKAHAATGKFKTPDVLAIQVIQAPRSVTGRELARRLGISEQVVSRIRSGQTHKDLHPKTEEGAAA